MIHRSQVNPDCEWKGTGDFWFTKSHLHITVQPVGLFLRAQKGQFRDHRGTIHRLLFFSALRDWPVKWTYPVFINRKLIEIPATWSTSTKRGLRTILGRDTDYPGLLFINLENPSTVLLLIRFMCVNLCSVTILEKLTTKRFVHGASYSKPV